MKPDLCSQVDHYQAARKEFEDVVVWLGLPEEPRSNSEIERALDSKGNIVLRILQQGYLNQCTEREGKELRALRELRKGREGENAAQNPEVIRKRTRAIVGKFGRVRHTRLSHKRPRLPAYFPLDGKLNVSKELYSLEVRQHVAIEASKGSFSETVASVDRNTGAHVPQRQAQELVKLAAQDFEAFYESRQGPANDAHQDELLEVASCDSKGITMLERALRDATRKAAEKDKESLVRGDPMSPKKLRKCDKRMAIVTANWEQKPEPRTVDDVLANFDRKPGQKKAKRPKPENKRVRGSVELDQADGIAEMFDEMQRRDPLHRRTALVLVDGELNQKEEVKKQALARGITIIIILDIIHVLHYLWMAGNALCKKDPLETAAWVRDFLKRLLTGNACTVAATIRRMATMSDLTETEREPVDTCCNYLIKNTPHLRYSEYLAKGYPIATGVIEGACRYLVQDRMGITGARWGLEGAEAVMKLRAIRCSDDWEEYWVFHEQQEYLRNHAAKAA